MTWLLNKIIHSTLHFIFKKKFNIVLRLRLISFKYVICLISFKYRSPFIVKCLFNLHYRIQIVWALIAPALLLVK